MRGVAPTASDVIRPNVAGLFSVALGLFITFEIALRG